MQRAHLLPEGNSSYLIILSIEKKKEIIKNSFKRVLRNLSEGIFLVICLGCHQKQPQNQWDSNGEVADKLWDICSHEALDFTVRNSKENDFSHGIKTSPTRPARHLKMTNKALGSHLWYYYSYYGKDCSVTRVRCQKLSFKHLIHTCVLDAMKLIHHMGKGNIVMQGFQKRFP